MKKQLPHGASGMILATVVLLAFVVVGIYSGKSAAPRAGGPRTGQKAPGLSFTTVDGKKVTLSDLKGKVVLLNFWATWCGPCRQEMPELIKLHNAYKERGFTVIGVSADDDQAPLDAFLKESPLPYPVGRVTHQQSDPFQIKALPTSILIDKSGEIVFDIDGYDPSLNFGELVEPYL